MTYYFLRTLSDSVVGKTSSRLDRHTDDFVEAAGSRMSPATRSSRTHPVYRANGAPIPNATLVFAIEACAFFSWPVRARIASIVSGMTIAWLSTM
jgi:hypothetical protein